MSRPHTIKTGNQYRRTDGKAGHVTLRSQMGERFFGLLCFPNGQEDSNSWNRHIIESFIGQGRWVPVVVPTTKLTLRRLYGV